MGAHTHWKYNVCSKAASKYTKALLAAASAVAHLLQRLPKVNLRIFVQDEKLIKHTNHLRGGASTFDLKAGGNITGISANFTIQLFGFSFDMYCVADYRAHAMIKFRASVLPTLIYLNEIEWDGHSAVSNELLTSWSGAVRLLSLRELRVSHWELPTPSLGKVFPPPH